MRPDAAFDEIYGTGGAPRDEFAALTAWIESIPHDDLKRRQDAAERAFPPDRHHLAVYGEEESAERIIPFDILPRMFSASE